MVQKFIRKEAAREISGYGYTEFYQAINDGRFPKPDGHLGPRSPFWAEATIAKWQRDTLAAGKPVAHTDATAAA
jgi:predicted DNA-binding transcriptional regulator AlpA